MSVISLLAGPAVGAVIGGITNKIAIMMLFRPYTAKHIGKFKLPLTPGIIPKEMPRIAKSIGDAVSVNLLNPETLHGTLLSEDIEQRIRQAVVNFVGKVTTNDNPLVDELQRYIPEESIQTFTSNAEDKLTQSLVEHLQGANLGDTVADAAIRHLKENATESLGRIAISLATSLFDNTIHNFISETVDNIIDDKAEPMLRDYLHKEIDSITHKSVSNIANLFTIDTDKIADIVLKIYREVIENSLPKALEAINLSKVVEERILSMDIRETERILLDIMDKELKALVWCGVGLGFIMGFVTPLFSNL